LKSALRLFEEGPFAVPNVIVEPVRKPCVYWKLPMSVRWTKAFVPVMNALDCGVV